MYLYVHKNSVNYVEINLTCLPQFCYEQAASLFFWHMCRWCSGIVDSRCGYKSLSCTWMFVKSLSGSSQTGEVRNFPSSALPPNVLLFVAPVSTQPSSLRQMAVHPEHGSSIKGSVCSPLSPSICSREICWVLLI